MNPECPSCQIELYKRVQEYRDYKTGYTKTMIYLFCIKCGTVYRTRKGQLIAFTPSAVVKASIEELK